MDISDLGPGSTEEQIREALNAPTCSSALVWVTPEVESSPVIRRVEVPSIIARVRANDDFFGVFVAAGGLDYNDATRIAAENAGAVDLRYWNLYKVMGDPATADELIAAADVVLDQRLKKIASHLSEGEEVRIGLWVRVPPPASGPGALELDWNESFTGRSATLASWEAELLPALASVHRHVARHLAGHPVVLHGLPTLAAATAIGRAFPAVAGVPIRWEQLAPDSSRTHWSLAHPLEDSGFTLRVSGSDPGGEGLAVLVSVLTDTSLAFGATRGLPRMRAVVEVVPPTVGTVPWLSPGRARHLVEEIAAAVRRARVDYIGIKEIHLFLAAPAGIAVLLGQLLNAVGPITLYEHVDADTVGYYRPEVRLPGSGIGV